MNFTAEDIYDIVQYLFILAQVTGSVFFRPGYSLLYHASPASRVIALCEYSEDTTITETQQCLQFVGRDTFLYLPGHLRFRRIKIISHLRPPFILLLNWFANAVPNACSAKKGLIYQYVRRFGAVSVF
jgi:hypothetical protein